MRGMEIDAPATTASGLPVPINLWCFLGKEGTKKVQVDLSLNELTLSSLKDFVCRIVGTISPKEIGKYSLHIFNCNRTSSVKRDLT